MQVVYSDQGLSEVLFEINDAAETLKLGKSPVDQYENTVWFEFSAE